MSKERLAALSSTAVILLTFAETARANTSYNVDYVNNGSFSLTTNGTGQLTFNTVATDWTSDKYKGFPILLEAIARIREIPDLFLLTLGHGPSSPEYPVPSRGVDSSRATWSNRQSINIGIMPIRVNR